MMRGDECAVVCDDAWLAIVKTPRPRVAKPQRRQYVQGRSVGSRVAHGDARNDVVGIGLRVVDDDVPVAVFFEHTSVEQLELRLVVATSRVLVDKLSIRELRLRVEVAPAHP